ncbi:hypothetical protein [Methylophaga sp.]|uniref:hypothetical protein n=1 Tax=Methylophaga sp. TaxID=2024840 RepID=UPI003A8E9137
MIDRVAKTVITRTINKGRITAFNSKWFSHALRTIEHKFEGMGISKKDRKVDVYVDVLNLGKLLIKDPFEEDNFIVAESTTPIYHNGLSLYEHNLFQEKRSAEFKVDLKTQRALTIERMEFIRSLHQSNSKSDRKKIARLSEVDSEDIDSEDIDYIEPKEKIVEKKQNKASPINLRQKISAPTFEVEED